MLDDGGIVLEPIAPESIEQMRLWRNNPSLRRYFREYKDISVDKQEWWYKNIGNNSSPDSVHFQVMQYDSDIDDRILIGYVGLIKIDFRVRSAEFSVYLGSGRGKGYGRRALEMLFAYGYNELNLHKITCEVYDNNNAVHLYRKMGFVDEGVLRDNYFCEGKYGNSIMMSMLMEEWYELRSRDEKYD